MVNPTRTTLAPSRWIAALLLALPLACHRPAARPPGPAAAPRAFGQLDTVWYVSARRLQDGRDTYAFADSLQYGLVRYTRAREGARPRLADSLVLDAATFASGLQARVRATPPPNDAAVLYVHGFATARREAWDYTAAAQAQASSAAPWVVFCWPSNGRGIDWPRPSEWLSRAYRQDERRAERAQPALRDAVQQLVATIGAPHLVLVAHSLGAQLVAEMLLTPPPNLGAPGQEFLRAIAFLSADIGAARFADTLQRPLRAVTSRVVLYVSARDRALRVARRVHGADRAGLVTAPPLVGPTFETVDITDAATTEGWWQQRFGNHHSIKFAAGALADLAHVVVTAVPAACRVTLGTAVPTAAGVWHLEPRPHPDDDAIQRCARLTATAR